MENTYKRSKGIFDPKDPVRIYNANVLEELINLARTRKNPIEDSYTNKLLKDKI